MRDRFFQGGRWRGLVLDGSYSPGWKFVFTKDWGWSMGGGSSSVLVVSLAVSLLLVGLFGRRGGIED